MRWPWHRETREQIAPKKWIAVDSEKRITAAADTFEELRQQPGFVESLHTVHEQDSDGKWWQMMGSYSTEHATEPKPSYIAPNADPLMRAVVRGRGA